MAEFRKAAGLEIQIMVQGGFVPEPRGWFQRQSS